MRKTDLPMADAPPLSPCLVCRRQLRIGGKRVFNTCFCSRHGRGATVLSLVVTAILFAVLAAFVAKQPRR